MNRELNISKARLAFNVFLNIRILYISFQITVTRCKKTNILKKKTKSETMKIIETAKLCNSDVVFSEVNKLHFPF